MNATKIFGWGLLIAGVIIIGWTLYSSYNIFNGKNGVPEIFELPKEKVKEPIKKGKITEIQNLESQLEKMIAEQFKEILPAEIVARLFNLISWSILAAILIFGGYQISNLGIKLINSVRKS